ncbi:MAG: hypothetical protein IJU25_01875, partial [Lachnospiraceae bacterium]|nr:hypothetical protein [Lachnospiraceae bacterium]
MKKDILKFISVLLCYVMLFNCFTFPVMAEELIPGPAPAGEEEEANPEMTVPEEEQIPTGAAEVSAQTPEAEEYDDPYIHRFTVQFRMEGEEVYGESVEDYQTDYFSSAVYEISRRQGNFDANIRINAQSTAYDVDVLTR